MEHKNQDMGQEIARLRTELQQQKQSLLQQRALQQ